MSTHNMLKLCSDSGLVGAGQMQVEPHLPLAPTGRAGNEATAAIPKPVLHGTDGCGVDVLCNKVEHLPSLLAVQQRVAGENMDRALARVYSQRKCTGKDGERDLQRPNNRANGPNRG
jgi:hypothetical protein